MIFNGNSTSMLMVFNKYAAPRRDLSNDTHCRVSKNLGISFNNLRTVPLMEAFKKIFGTTGFLYLVAYSVNKLGLYYQTPGILSFFYQYLK